MLELAYLVQRESYRRKVQKRKKSPNVAKNVLPAKLKVEAQSDSDVLDKDSSDDLTSDEDCPGVKECPNAKNAKSPEASGVLDDSSHMFGRVVQLRSMAQWQTYPCGRQSLESSLNLFKLILTPSQRHTGTCLVTGSTAELSSHPESHLVPRSMVMKINVCFFFPF